MKYPDIKVKLTGKDGNAFAVLGAVHGALRKNGVDRKECAEFMSQATEGDYDHLLQTCMEWVSIS